MSQAANVARTTPGPGGDAGQPLARWLRRRRFPLLATIGLIAFGNKTYTNFTPTFDAAFDLLARTGGLQPRTIEPPGSPKSSSRSGQVAAVSGRVSNVPGPRGPAGRGMAPVNHPHPRPRHVPAGRPAGPRVSAGR